MTLYVISRTRINDSLDRTEFSLVNDDKSKDQYRHNVVQFELHSWPNEDDINPEDTAMVVSTICLIRNEMTAKKASLQVLVTDFRGGVGAGAVFLAMYEAMQEVDEAFTHDNQLKKSASDIDVFSIVNRLRKDRDRMVEDYDTYKFIFKCLGYYGQNRRQLNQMERSNEARIQRMARTTTELEDGFRYNDWERNDTNQEAVYVIDQLQGDDNNIFDEPYNISINDHNRYQNIEDMSEYI